MKKIFAIASILLTVTACDICSTYEGYDWEEEQQKEEKQLAQKQAEEDVYYNKIATSGTINADFGIHIANGLHLANYHRSAQISGVVTEFEFWLENDAVDITDYVIIQMTYRYHPIDTLFAETRTVSIRIEPQKLTTWHPPEITIGSWYFELLSISVVNADYDCHLHYGKEYHPIRKIIFNGNITVRGNNDYQRLTCEAGHACDGKYSNTIGGGTLCNDGWTSLSTGSGTCSWHGGIAH